MILSLFQDVVKDPTVIGSSLFLGYSILYPYIYHREDKLGTIPSLIAFFSTGFIVLLVYSFYFLAGTDVSKFTIEVHNATILPISIFASVSSTIFVFKENLKMDDIELYPLDLFILHSLWLVMIMMYEYPSWNLPIGLFLWLTLPLFMYSFLSSGLIGLAKYEWEKINSF